MLLSMWKQGSAFEVPADVHAHTDDRDVEENAGSHAVVPVCVGEAVAVVVDGRRVVEKMYPTSRTESFCGARVRRSSMGTMEFKGSLPML